MSARLRRYRRLFLEGLDRAWNPRWKLLLWCTIGAFIGMSGRAW